MSELDEPRALAAYAKRAGLDLFEFLERQGWLATTSATRRVEVERLRDLQRSMQRWDAHEYLRRVDRNGPWSPQQMLEAIHLYIEDYITAVIRGEL